MDRGLTMTDIRRSQIGQLVDFCIEYNERQEEIHTKAEREQEKGKRRRGTQNDINAFFG